MVDDGAMATRFRRSRSWRVLRWVLGICLLAALWKAVWLFGPRMVGGSDAPAIFPLHAQVLLRAGLGPSKPVHATLPPPEKGTSAEAQLRLMGLWDGRAWTGKAAQSGRVQGRLLRVPAGRIAFTRITGVSAARSENGVLTCRIDYKIRWDWPDPERELLRVAPIIGLQSPSPAGFAAPGQEAARFMVLEREGWSWRPREARSVPAEATGREMMWSWLARIF